MNTDHNQDKTVIFFNKFGNALEKSLDELARLGEPASCLLQRVWLAFPSISAIPLYVTHKAHVEIHAGVAIPCPLILTADK